MPYRRETAVSLQGLAPCPKPLVTDSELARSVPPTLPAEHGKERTLPEVLPTDVPAPPSFSNDNNVEPEVKPLPR